MYNIQIRRFHYFDALPQVMKNCIVYVSSFPLKPQRTFTTDITFLFSFSPSSAPIYMDIAQLFSNTHKKVKLTLLERCNLLWGNVHGEVSFRYRGSVKLSR